MRFRGYSQWPAYVPVASRRVSAARHARQSAVDGVELQPVVTEGRAIASSFWGKAWCDSLERYSDYQNRLPRGRTYVRNGSVIDLKIGPGTVDALVSGSEIYTVTVQIGSLARNRWRSLIAECSGHIGSLLDLLRGHFAAGVMQVLARPDGGLFPVPKEMQFSCSCPDVASMCKHVAAVLYGVGARFDTAPELFFTLRQVDSKDLIAAAAGAEGLTGASPRHAGETLQEADLGSVFGIELDESQALPAPTPAAAPARAPAKRRAPKARKAQRSRADDDGFEEVFGPGREVTPALLVGFGVPRTTFPNWLTTGVLVRTQTRGVYRTTPATLDRVRRAFARSLR